MSGFKLRSYQLAAWGASSSFAQAIIAARQAGKTAVSEETARALERNGWQRGNSEGYDMWIGNADSHWTHDWTHHKFHHTMLPTIEPMTLQQFCQKFYPEPEIGPEVASLAIFNNLKNSGLMNNIVHHLDYLHQQQTIHDNGFNKLLREFILKEIMYGAGNFKLGGRTTNTASTW